MDPDGVSIVLHESGVVQEQKNPRRTMRELSGLQSPHSFETVPSGTLFEFEPD
jgi:hypothetical protein